MTDCARFTDYILVIEHRVFGRALRTPLMLFESISARSGHAAERRGENLWQAGVKANSDTGRENISQSPW